MVLDGQEVQFTEGETIYEVSLRHAEKVPTLCYDERLEAFGACRLCVVEVEGSRNPVASCTTKCTPGMKVKTRTEVIGAQIADGRLSVNEARALEDRTPVDGGDFHNVPSPGTTPASTR